MYNHKMIKQAIDYNRNLFNSAFTAWVQVQDNVEQLTETALSGANWLPPEGKTVVSGWTDACKKGREEYKHNVNSGFKKLEELFGNA